MLLAFTRRRAVFVASVVALLVVAPQPMASAGQLGSFTTGDGLYSYSGGVLTTNGPIDGSFIFASLAIDLGASPLGNIDATIDLLATRTADVQDDGGGFYSQLMSGSIAIKDSDSLLLGVNFTDAQLIVRAVAGSILSVSFEAFSALGASITFSSDKFDDSLVGDPSNFRFTFNTVSAGPFSTTGGNFNDFTVENGSVYEASLVPEPSTFAAAFASLPLFGGYWLARRRRKRM